MAKKPRAVRGPIIYGRERHSHRCEGRRCRSYGFVLVSMLGQPTAFQAKFLEGVRDAATRKELPEDAVAFAETRLRQTEMENRYKTHLPSDPELRDQISRLFKDDQAVRERERFDARKMEEADRRTADPLNHLQSIRRADLGHGGCAGGEVLCRYGSASAGGVSRRGVAEVQGQRGCGQADPGMYATVYDRSQRDQGKNQPYGEQLESTSGKALEEAPMDDQES